MSTDPTGTESNQKITIEQLLGIESCREAARRYSHGVDRLDVEVMKSAFWPDATDDHGLFVGNAWDFCKIVVDSHDRWSWTMHTISNHRVEIDGQTGRGELYNIVHLFTEEKRRLDTWYSRYLDTYACRDGEWRISHRVCTHDGDVSEVLPETMGIDTSTFRPGSFDRPGHQRTLGP